MTPFAVPTILQVIEHDDNRESGYMGLRAAQEARFFTFLPDWARDEYELIGAKAPSSFMEIDDLPAPPCEFYDGEFLLTEVEMVADAICDLDAAILTFGLPSDADHVETSWETRPGVTQRNRGLRDRMWKEAFAERAAGRALREAQNEVRALYMAAIMAADEIEREQKTLNRIEAEIRRMHVREAKEEKATRHQAAVAAGVPTRDDINRLRRELPFVKFAFGGGISPNWLKGKDLVEIWVALFAGRNEGEFQGVVSEFLNAIRYSMGEYTVVVTPGENVRVRIMKRREDNDDRRTVGGILVGRTAERADSRSAAAAAA